MLIVWSPLPPPPPHCSGVQLRESFMSKLIAAFVVVLSVVVMGSCGASGLGAGDGGAAGVMGAGEQTTLVIVRHAERGSQGRDPDLTEAGRERAKRLVGVVKDAGVDTVYTSETTRTKSTAAGVVGAMGIAKERQREYDSNASPSVLAERLLAEEGGHVILVVGHSHVIPKLLTALGWETGPMGDSDYDDVYVVTIASGKATGLIRTAYPAAGRR